MLGMDELQEHARLLIELDEPEALLESLKRACQAKADSTAEGQRWRTAASALSQASDTIAASQEPKGAAHEPDEPNPEPGAVPAEGEAASPIP
jgi:hypothetical protein